MTWLFENVRTMRVSLAFILASIQNEFQQIYAIQIFIISALFLFNGPNAFNSNENVNRLFYPQFRMNLFCLANFSDLCVKFYEFNI